MKNKSTEDYLKHIFWLSRMRDKITTKAIAERMGISSASVTDMIKKLTHHGYLDYTPYYGVRLTTKGDKLALKVIRRHRLLEAFLVKALGYSWEAVHDEAERLEHVISEEMEHRLDEFLGHPRYDPHGDPIPTHEGKMEEIHHPSLAELSVGDTARIMQVRDSEELLKYMKRIRLSLNSRIRICAKESYDNSMRLRIDGKEEHTLSHDVTSNIFVKKEKEKK
ncbi:MAG TPA: metal-dependent transcriptional regulator [bacterium]|nr:metal-dependent transcriptional regulator [bacterium]HMY37382.1 metal-dependent transcriptional regulator [bacterium]HNO91804.1 metal-dependent transcriptional regulator [bacterium]